MTLKRKRVFTLGPRKRRRFIKRDPMVVVVQPSRFLSPLEVKFADIESNSDAFATNWATMEDATNDSISGVAIGDTESSRDGRVYHIHSIHIKGRIQVASTEMVGTPQPDLFGRICLVLDTQTNGSQLTATDVMVGTGTDDVLAFRNLRHTKRFQVLWDKKWLLRSFVTNEGAANLYAQQNQSTAIFSFNRRFKTPIKVICSGTDATISSLSDNSLHVIGVANSVGALLSYQARLRFTG